MNINGKHPERELIKNLLAAAAGILIAIVVVILLASFIMGNW